jgi:hypothetical protein
MKESVIQRGILDYLELFSRTNPVYYFRAGAGAMKTAQGRFFKTGKAGLSDIVVCYAGRFIGLEVKTKSGRQSQSQKNAEQEIKASGGEYYVVRSVADVKEILPL